MSLILQRYYFFCKSQQISKNCWICLWCLWYYKGTIFFANHNPLWSWSLRVWCLWYYKGTIFFANHNTCWIPVLSCRDVFDITKVLFFLQITTPVRRWCSCLQMSLILQRYYFFCKSQRLHPSLLNCSRCLWYYKGTIFFANHNQCRTWIDNQCDVFDITNVLFFLQITTLTVSLCTGILMSLILQRY